MKKSSKFFDLGKIIGSDFSKVSVMTRVFIIVLIIINLALAFTGQRGVPAYFIPNALAFIVFALFYIHLKPGSRFIMSIAVTAVFGLFLVLVILRIFTILS